MGSDVVFGAHYRGRVDRYPRVVDEGVLLWHISGFYLAHLGCRPGVGVTKAPFVNFSVSKMFDLAKVHVTVFESRSYLTGVTAAGLRQHLSNMNLILNS